LLKVYTMTTIQINEKTKIGKNVLEMLKALAKADKNDSIRFLDETDYLFSIEANKEALMNGVAQVEKGDNGKTIQIADLWK
jgi:hypothetical protein